MNSRRTIFEGEGANLKTGERVRFKVSEGISAKCVESLITNIWIERLRSDSTVFKRFSLDFQPEEFGIIILDSLPARNQDHMDLIRKFSERLKADREMDDQGKK